MYKLVANTWARIGTATTQANGYYNFRFNEAAAGTASNSYEFQYVTNFAGDSSFKKSTSSVISVSFYYVPTAVTATALHQEAHMGQNNTINGSHTANGMPLAGQQVSSYRCQAQGMDTNLGNVTTESHGSYTVCFVEAEAALGHRENLFSYYVLHWGNAATANPHHRNYRSTI